MRPVPLCCGRGKGGSKKGGGAKGKVRKVEGQRAKVRKGKSKEGLRGKGQRGKEEKERGLLGKVPAWGKGRRGENKSKISFLSNASLAMRPPRRDEAAGSFLTGCAPLVWRRADVRHDRQAPSGGARRGRVRRGGGRRGAWDDARRAVSPRAMPHAA
eukprot:364403-Chlamydomonas_euryale.AAC.6